MGEKEQYVVNIFGERGEGKTTLSAGFFYYLKSLGHKAYVFLDFSPSDKTFWGEETLRERAGRYNTLGEGYIVTNNPLLRGLLVPEQSPSFYSSVRNTFKSFRNINVLVKIPSERREKRGGEGETEKLLIREKVPFFPHERFDFGHRDLISLYEEVRTYRQKYFGESSFFDPLRALEFSCLKEYRELFGEDFVEN